MKNEQNVIDLPETEVNEIEVSKSEGLLSKAKTFIKKHGKKIAVATAIGAGTLIGYALGSRTDGGDNGDLDSVIDVDHTEVEDVNVDE